MSDKDKFIKVISVPVNMDQRDRYYLIASKLNEIRDRRDGQKPKKISGLAREALVEMMDKIDEWLNSQE